MSCEVGENHNRMAALYGKSRDATSLAERTGSLFQFGGVRLVTLADGGERDIRLISGYFHQDWLACPTDRNWRLETEVGGELRSVGDIGTHWVDLTSCITGLRADEVMAELPTFVKERHSHYS